MNEHRRSMQATLLVVASADNFKPRHQPTFKPRPLNLATLDTELIARPLPQESMMTEPDPYYMDRQRNANWRGTHD